MRLRAIALASLLAIPPLLTLSPGAPLQGPPAAEASVSVLLSLDEIVAASTAVVVGTAGERKTQWEEMPTGRRIVTYTKVTVDRAIAGSPGSEVWVRTLGGTVGDIGQAVSGEAQLARGSKSVLFLMKRGDVTMVTAMAQGHYPVVNDDKGVARLKLSPDVGTQLRTPGPVIAARDVLVGQTVDTAATAIAKVRKALDEKKK
jgi:hypothetical protein